jgi:UMF1 family MFS transporter
VQSLRSLRQTWKRLVREDRNLLTFMMAYWLYIDGVYTVMTMAVDYGMSIGLESKDLIAALLITQFIGFPFAYYFGKVTGRFGTKLPILTCILVYSVTVVAATFMSQAWHFYLLAVVIGMVQGGVQSLSRSLFGKMAPKEQSGEYFGLFNLVGRFAAILGPLLVAAMVTVTGNSRMGMTGLLVLFVIGGGLLARIQEPQDHKISTH